MPSKSASRGLLLSLAALLVVCTGVAAQQNVPWESFEDPDTGTVCDLIIAENVELLLLTATRELVIVSSDSVNIVPDIILARTQVTPAAAGLDVFFDGAPAGFLAFDDAADGFASVWWLSSTGRVMTVDVNTGRPTPSSLFPTNFINVPCDEGLNFWDGCISDSECADNNFCTLDLCEAGECVYVNRSVACDDGDPCTRLDACIDGVCEGIPIPDCGVSPLPPVVISICGSNSAAALALTAVGLGLMGAARRRRRG